MFKKVKYAASQIGLGIASIYAFFMVPSIQELFSPTFLILLRQTLAICFAICLGINPRQLIQLGEQFAPKIITFFKIFFTHDKTKNNDEF